MTKPWNAVETRFLRDNHTKLSVEQLSIELGRSVRAIKSAVATLGLGGAGPTGPAPLLPGAKSHQGLREDLGVSFRSSWEANLARVLDHLSILWQYEPKTFVFPNEVRGSRTYTPDFFLPELGIWLEVKGHLDSKGRSKLKKFRKYFPSEWAALKAVPGTNKSPSAQWFAEQGVPVFAFYNVLRYDYALEIAHWEHDPASEKWKTSTRKRKRPEDLSLPFVPRKRRRKGTDEALQHASTKSSSPVVYTADPSRQTPGAAPSRRRRAPAQKAA